MTLYLDSKIFSPHFGFNENPEVKWGGTPSDYLPAAFLLNFVFNLLRSKRKSDWSNQKRSGVSLVMADWCLVVAGNKGEGRASIRCTSQVYLPEGCCSVTSGPLRWCLQLSLTAITGLLFH